MVENYFIIDAHCHVYPDKIAAPAVASTGKFYGLDTACLGTTSDLIERGGNAGIDHYIIQSVATAPKQVESINRFIANSVLAGNGKFTGLGTLHPDSSNLKGDIALIKELGLHGVKLHPDIQEFKIDDYRCLKIYELCEQEDLPILMHSCLPMLRSMLLLRLECPKDEFRWLKLQSILPLARRAILPIWVLPRQ